MEYKKYKKHGLTVETDDGLVAISEIFNFLGGSTFPTEGINGICHLRDDSGYYNGDKLEISSFEETENGIEISFKSPYTEYIAAFEFIGDGVWKRCDRIKNI